MRKATNENSGDIIITVSRLGSDPVNVRFENEDDATVEAAIRKAGIELPENAELMVFGEDAELNDILENGDILTISTRKQAGS